MSTFGRRMHVWRNWTSRANCQELREKLVLRRGLNQGILLLEMNMMVLLNNVLEHKCRQSKLHLGALIPIVISRIKIETPHRDIDIYEVWKICLRPRVTTISLFERKENYRFTVSLSSSLIIFLHTKYSANVRNI